MAGYTQLERELTYPDRYLIINFKVATNLLYAACASAHVREATGKACGTDARCYPCYATVGPVTRRTPPRPRCVDLFKYLTVRGIVARLLSILKSACQSFRDSYHPGELLLTSPTRTHSIPHTWSVMAMLGMGINWEILDS
ncbi:hypothetical protein B0H14DRAFT_2620558 [Mycena olivaceomarginata]|nr:hypothetical protein B0H14DRAFT_2620558 [Mycena olivaceomarginata]